MKHALAKFYSENIEGKFNESHSLLTFCTPNLYFNSSPSGAK
jgi:hypothetical protein